MQDFEKLGAFFLGKRHELAGGATSDDLLLYDAKDLTTHAVCVGMTGSGKTGLCLALLEEAGIDGIPAIVIDPKGDLANLLLTFPQLRPEDFRPWIDESAAARKGISPDELAAETAATWREGLAGWGQDGERIARFRDAVELAIYTPGSTAGLPLTVLRSFDAPPQAVLDDADAFRTRLASAASGLLALLGIDADPVRSREHILVSNILDHAWRAGRSLDLAGLIAEIQKPPFERVGIMELDAFFPADDRLELSMTLNNLLASPSFAGWLEGEPLDVKRLLYTPQGKPRISILSIAHLSDPERMFFVTILLNEVLSWMRGQPGTSALRALLYMDEVFGYFPPTANPPSKTPMLTLLKQARAYGLGVVLATQNPVDLDYKGLSNTGTWFLGRLQTERDKARVLEGLEGASVQAGASFDRGKIEATLAGLGRRVFLMNNAHEDEPVVFHTRWCLSYLRGPLTRGQIQTLMSEQKAAAPAAAPGPAAAENKPQEPAATLAEGFGDFDDLEPVRTAPSASPQANDAPPQRGAVPAGIPELFAAANNPQDKNGRLVYRPALLGRGKMHFVRVTYGVDVWRPVSLLAPLSEKSDDLWTHAATLDKELPLNDGPAPAAEFTDLPAAATNPRTYAGWRRRLKDHLYQTATLHVWHCPELKQYSEPDEPEDDFRIRLSQQLREQRQEQIEDLRENYAKKLATLESRIKTAEERVAREEAQYKQRSFESAVSVGSTILGALFGRKLASSSNVGRASTSARSVGRAARERGDVGRAEAKLRDAREELAGLQREFDAEVQKVNATLTPEKLVLEPLTVRPRKSDMALEDVALVWTPWFIDGDGQSHPAFDVDI